MLLVLAVVHLCPLPIAAVHLKDERCHPGAVVFHVVCSPPNVDDDIVLSSIGFSSKSSVM